MTNAERQARHAYIAQRLRNEATRETTNATIWVRTLNDFLQRQQQPATVYGIDVLNGVGNPHNDASKNLLAIKTGSRKAIQAAKLAKRLARIAKRYEHKAGDTQL